MTKTALTGTTILALSLSTLTAHAEDLVVGMFGGNFAKAVTQCHVQPYEAATGDTVIPQEGSSSQFASMVRATGGTSDFDVIYIDNSFAAQLASEGLSEKLDRAKITHTADLPEAVWGADDHFVQFQWAATTIAYNPKAYPTPPDSWAAIFDAAPSGNVALPDISGTAGVHFLLAAAKLNGGSLENLDPGFEAIKKIAPDIKAYYTQADQIIAMFERGEVDIAPWYQDRAAAAAAAGVPVAIAYPKEGAIGINVTMVIPKGAANPEGAYKYIDTLLSPEAQKCLADVMYEGPVNTKVSLTGPAAEALPPEIFKTLDFPDPEYVAANVADWRARWQREITR
ncbi:ABC transporter substrate-binding protein [Paracoccus shanxieyensis]|uniref:Extracellular solute-binding protein n=1 Tax=Paracoccus shanxieyensis TaxID=2675752 RepID=A0A6L6J287_9RHOB|nr:ABC transporter substrate-binding protein [Paracoccus shanxieyensis]MTH66673.1 extracellular solute-binding protein [Paracoccus shanxieyensis]MTH89908.1 extracellular solute-binding protein [Paracoccus shanxieyensis]